MRRFTWDGGTAGAYWARTNSARLQFTDAIAQAGSAFKPFALVAALEQAVLGRGYPATSPMTIEGHEFQNFKNVSLKWASLTQATEQMLTTPYLQLNQSHKCR